MRKSTKAPSGIEWTMNSQLEDLDFADDVCLMSHRKSFMKNKLAKLVYYTEQVGLIVNVKKTKFMQFNTNNQIGMISQLITKI
jgi:hypothetical protein